MGRITQKAAVTSMQEIACIHICMPSHLMNAQMLVAAWFLPQTRHTLYRKWSGHVWVYHTKWSLHSFLYMSDIYAGWLAWNFLFFCKYRFIWLDIFLILAFINCFLHVVLWRWLVVIYYSSNMWRIIHFGAVTFCPSVYTHCITPVTLQ